MKTTSCKTERYQQQQPRNSWLCVFVEEGLLPLSFYSILAAGCYCIFNYLALLKLLEFLMALYIWYISYPSSPKKGRNGRETFQVWIKPLDEITPISGALEWVKINNNNINILLPSSVLQHRHQNVFIGSFSLSLWCQVACTLRFIIKGCNSRNSLMSRSSKWKMCTIPISTG